MAALKKRLVRESKATRTVLWRNNMTDRAELLAAKVSLENALLHLNRALGEDDGKALADTK